MARLPEPPRVVVPRTPDTAAESPHPSGYTPFGSEMVNLPARRAARLDPVTALRTGGLYQGESVAPSWRGIPPGGVAPRSNTACMLPRRALQWPVAA